MSMDDADIAELLVGEAEPAAAHDQPTETPSTTTTTTTTTIATPPPATLPTTTTTTTTTMVAASSQEPEQDMAERLRTYTHVEHSGAQPSLHRRLQQSQTASPTACLLPDGTFALAVSEHTWRTNSKTGKKQRNATQPTWVYDEDGDGYRNEETMMETTMPRAANDPQTSSQSTNNNTKSSSGTTNSLDCDSDSCSDSDSAPMMSSIVDFDDDEDDDDQQRPLRGGGGDDHGASDTDTDDSDSSSDEEGSDNGNDDVDDDDDGAGPRTAALLALLGDDNETAHEDDGDWWMRQFVVVAPPPPPSSIKRTMWLVIFVGVVILDSLLAIALPNVGTRQYNLSEPKYVLSMMAIFIDAIGVACMIRNHNWLPVYMLLATVDITSTLIFWANPVSIWRVATEGTALCIAYYLHENSRYRWHTATRTHA